MSFQFGFEGAQNAKAIAFEFFDPAFLNLKQRHRVQVMELFPALPNHCNQIGRFQLLQVLCNGLPGHVHVLAECRQCLAVVGVQLVKQASSPRICQRFEYFVDVQVVFR